MWPVFSGASCKEAPECSARALCLGVISIRTSGTSLTACPSAVFTLKPEMRMIQQVFGRSKPTAERAEEQLIADSVLVGANTDHKKQLAEAVYWLIRSP